jgi:outer membrane protein OmpA-like peptidoglycan-associated protein
MKSSKGEVYQPFIFAGEMAFKEGRLRDAEGYFKESLGIQELSSTHLRLSLVYRSLLDWDKAIEEYGIYVDRAKLTPRRLEVAQQQLMDYEFAREAYGQFVQDSLKWRIEMLPFSTEAMEYFPCITGDGTELVFTQRNPDGQRKDEDLFSVDHTGRGWSSRAVPLKGFLNGTGNEGAATISADGKMMVFTACDRPGGRGSCDLYYSFWNPELGWDRPELLPGEVNTGGWESQPSLAPDGRTLYFVRGRRNTDENLDIFQAKLDSTGNWGHVKALPGNINKEGQETSPFIHFDGLTLIFASNQSPSIGGKDFFITERLSDSTWTDPVNIGMPLNGFTDEFSMILKPDGRGGFFASDRGADFTNGVGDMRFLDLYEFSLPEEMWVNAVHHFDVRVVDAQTGLIISNAEIKGYDRATNELVFEGFSRPYTGVARLMLSEDMYYGLVATKEGYLPVSKVVRSKGDGVVELAMEKITSGTTISLNNILFETDESTLLPASERELRSLLRILNSQPELAAKIIGHTDNVGSVTYNKALSLRRAKAVVEWLTGHGIATERLSYEGKGSSEPVASNETEDGRALNRRTEVRLD